jgi:hypothetical protein
MMHLLFFMVAWNYSWRLNPPNDPKNKRPLYTIEVYDYEVYIWKNVYIDRCNMDKLKISVVLHH